MLVAASLLGGAKLRWSNRHDHRMRFTPKLKDTLGSPDGTGTNTVLWLPTSDDTISWKMD
jgi:hypothetical protein